VLKTCSCVCPVLQDSSSPVNLGDYSFDNQSINQIFGTSNKDVFVIPSNISFEFKTLGGEDEFTLPNDISSYQQSISGNRLTLSGNNQTLYFYATPTMQTLKNTTNYQLQIVNGAVVFEPISTETNVDIEGRYYSAVSYQNLFSDKLQIGTTASTDFATNWIEKTSENTVTFTSSTEQFVGVNYQNGSPSLLGRYFDTDDGDTLEANLESDGIMTWPNLPKAGDFDGNEEYLDVNFTGIVPIYQDQVTNRNVYALGFSSTKRYNDNTPAETEVTNLINFILPRTDRSTSILPNISGSKYGVLEFNSNQSDSSFFEAFTEMYRVELDESGTNLTRFADSEHQISLDFAGRNLAILAPDSNGVDKTAVISDFQDGTIDVLWNDDNTTSPSALAFTPDGLLGMGTLFHTRTQESDGGLSLPIEACNNELTVSEEQLSQCYMGMQFWVKLPDAQTNEQILAELDGKTYRFTVYQANLEYSDARVEYSFRSDIDAISLKFENQETGFIAKAIEANTRGTRLNIEQTDNGLFLESTQREAYTAEQAAEDADQNYFLLSNDSPSSVGEFLMVNPLGQDMQQGIDLEGSAIRFFTSADGDDSDKAPDLILGVVYEYGIDGDESEKAMLVVIGRPE